MIVLGLHGGLTNRQHEPGVALVINGKLVAVCEEERYLRIKSAYGYMPEYSIRAALKQAGIKWEDIDLIITPGITYEGFDAHVRHYLTHLFGSCPKVQCIHHHHAHIASAFYASGLEESLVLTVDSSGDKVSTMLGYASKASGIEIFEDRLGRDSLGLFYTLMTFYLGFTDGDEYKVMGLAPYGQNEIDLSSVIRTTNYGWELEHTYFQNNPSPLSPFQPNYNQKLIDLLKHPARTPTGEMTQFYKDIALSTQKTFERCLNSLVSYLKSKMPHIRNLCYAGGAALNCRANKALLNSDDWDCVFVPPFSSDRGLAVGCAYYGAAMSGQGIWPLADAYLGSGYSDASIQQELTANGVTFREAADPAQEAASLLAQNKIIGWYQGRSEAGARSLGNRSILASCSSVDMRDQVNKKIKYREEFRPFAPAAQYEEAHRYFEHRNQSLPWMCFAVDAKDSAQESIPAVIHHDHTARLQTVKSSDNALFYSMIQQYADQTSVPVVLNTSFNLKGQPIVETPRDALMTFFGCGLDALIMGPFIIEKLGFS